MSALGRPTIHLPSEGEIPLTVYGALTPDHEGRTEGNPKQARQLLCWTERNSPARAPENQRQPHSAHERNRPERALEARSPMAGIRKAPCLTNRSVKAENWIRPGAVQEESCPMAGTRAASRGSETTAVPDSRNRPGRVQERRSNVAGSRAASRGSDKTGCLQAGLGDSGSGSDNNTNQSASSGSPWSSSSSPTRRARLSGHSSMNVNSDAGSCSPLMIARIQPSEESGHAGHRPSSPSQKNYKQRHAACRPSSPSHEKQQYGDAAFRPSSPSLIQQGAGRGIVWAADALFASSSNERVNKVVRLLLGQKIVQGKKDLVSTINHPICLSVYCHVVCFS